MKHDYHIGHLGRERGWFKPHRYRYSCMRCGWAFIVESRSGSITAVGRNGQPLSGPESLKRIATFAEGPCEPALDRANQRLRTAESEPARARVPVRGAAKLIDPK